MYSGITLRGRSILQFNKRSLRIFPDVVVVTRWLCKNDCQKKVKKVPAKFTQAGKARRCLKVVISYVSNLGKKSYVADTIIWLCLQWGHVKVLDRLHLQALVHQAHHCLVGVFNFVEPCQKYLFQPFFLNQAGIWNTTGCYHRSPKGVLEH